MVERSRWLAVGLVTALSLVPARAAAEGAGTAPLADDPTLIALAVALACADAPEVIPAAPAGSGEPSAAGPELELVATVRAKALQFDELPKVEVLFRGSGKRRTVWRTERVNLPAHPEPGVVYRDVQVRLTISSDIEELTTMLREAKRASAGVRIQGGAEPRVVPTSAQRPVEVAPPAVPVPTSAPATTLPPPLPASPAPALIQPAPGSAP